MFVWAVLTFLDQEVERRKEKKEDNLPLLDLSASPQVKNDEHDPFQAPDGQARDRGDLAHSYFPRELRHELY